MNQGKKKTHTHTQIMPNQENISLLITQQKLLFLILPRDKSVYDKNKIKKKIENQNQNHKINQNSFRKCRNLWGSDFYLEDLQDEISMSASVGYSPCSTVKDQEKSETRTRTRDENGSGSRQGNLLTNLF